MVYIDSDLKRPHMLISRSFGRELDCDEAIADLLLGAGTCSGEVNVNVYKILFFLCFLATFLHQALRLYFSCIGERELWAENVNQNKAVKYCVSLTRNKYIVHRLTFLELLGLSLSFHVQCGHLLTKLSYFQVTKAMLATENMRRNGAEFQSFQGWLTLAFCLNGSWLSILFSLPPPFSWSQGTKSLLWCF